MVRTATASAVVDSPTMTIPAIGKIGSAIAAFTAAQSLWQRARNELRNRTEYTITVDSSDALYPAVTAAVLDEIDPGSRRSVEMVSSHRYSSDGMVAAPEDDHAERPPPIRWVYEGSKWSTLRLNGHRIRVSIDENDTGPKEYARRRLRFVAPTLTARDAVYDFLIEIASRRSERKPELRIPNRWGNWEIRGDLPGRTLDTVVLDAGLRQRIVADLDRFLHLEDTYSRTGMPFHRGYLFYGPPGTGKTSVARAVAAHFGLSIYYLPLSDLGSDVDLLALVTSVPARSVLLIEDADIAHTAKDRDDERKGASLAALLNALDGVFTPHGLIKILTTNHRHMLDDAVVRPGRIDFEAEFGLASLDQVHGLWRLMYQTEPPRALDNAVGVAPSAIIGKFLSHPDNPIGGLQALVGEAVRL